MGLREIRKNKGYTIVQVAKAIGISDVYLSLLERGERRINNEVLKKITDYYNCSANDIFDDSDSKRNVVDLLPREHKDIIELFEMLQDGDKIIIEKSMEHLINDDLKADLIRKINSSKK